MKIICHIANKCPKFIKNLYHNIRDTIKVIYYNNIQNKYTLIEKQVKNKIKKDKVVRVGFYIIFDASWGSRPVFESMLEDIVFDPKIVVCPDITRGEDHKWKTIETVQKTCMNKYGENRVLCSYNKEKNAFIDYSDAFDLIFLANPYDSMTYKFYTTNYLRKKKLTLFCDYGYSGKLKWEIQQYKSDAYNLFWKQFVDNDSTRLIQRKEQFIKDRNVVVSGSCKMDKLYNRKINKQNEYIKTIIIAPHHTVRKTKGFLNLSNFIRFADLIQRLPKKYPNIKFIFRPHPLLFTALSCDDLWGERKVNDYLIELQSNKNVVYSTEGEYFDVFAESDAMIDDCGSFLAEYFYTNKPQCYVLQNNDTLENEYLDFGKEFFNYVYKAFTEDDIYSFIDDIVLNENDYLSEQRDMFAKSKVMINYPNVNHFIIDYIKQQLF